MKLAIAGGTGQAGTQAARAARERGHEVIVLARSAGVGLVTGAGTAAALDGGGRGHRRLRCEPQR